MFASASTTKLTVAAIIRNDEGVYEGNLVSYFRVVFLYAQNLRNPYHNFRHMLHVMCRCYEAGIYYGKKLSLTQKRNLLIAALFHDFDHSGQMSNDDINVEKAVRGFKIHVRPEDYGRFGAIVSLIRDTEYPYRISSKDLDLSGQILRDADLAQALDTAWIQQVIFGLSQEWGKTPLEVLEGQVGFHKKLTFATDWAKERFPQSVISEKVAEAGEMLSLLKNEGP